MTSCREGEKACSLYNAVDIDRLGKQEENMRLVVIVIKEKGHLMSGI